MNSDQQLQQIIDNQERLIALKQEQLKVNKQGLDIQNKLFERSDAQLLRAEQINDNAVVIQKRAMKTQKLLLPMLVVVVVLIMLLTFM